MVSPLSFVLLFPLLSLSRFFFIFFFSRKTSRARISCSLRILEIVGINVGRNDFVDEFQNATIISKNVEFSLTNINSRKSGFLKME